MFVNRVVFCEVTMERYVERVDAYLQTFLEKEGYKLIKTEFVKEDGNYFLRSYIDLIPGSYEEGREISINDCAKVSRRLSKWLDKEDFIKEAYTLEVCSKGFLSDEGQPEEV